MREDFDRAFESLQQQAHATAAERDAAWAELRRVQSALGGEEGEGWGQDSLDQFVVDSCLVSGAHARAVGRVCGGWSRTF